MESLSLEFTRSFRSNYTTQHDGRNGVLTNEEFSSRKAKRGSQISSGLEMGLGHNHTSESCVLVRVIAQC